MTGRRTKRFIPQRPDGAPAETEQHPRTPDPRWTGHDPALTNPVAESRRRTLIECLRPASPIR